MNERLRAARDRVSKLERAKRRLDELRERSRQLETRVGNLAMRLARERKDVERLEELSVQSIWHSVCGNKPETLAREKLQAVEAQAKHDEAVALLGETRQQFQAMQADADALADAPAELARWLAETEAELKVSGTPAGERLQEIALRAAESRDVLLELEEARSAAQCAIVALARVEGHLGSARNWGGLDMLGGGFITTAIKHDRIRSARAALATAQAHVRNLGRELEDVGRIGGFLLSTMSDGITAEIMP